MKKSLIFTNRTLATRLGAALSALALCVGLASCGSNQEGQADPAAQKAGLTLLNGISASGDLGKKPKVTFDTPLTVKDKSYAILQHGNGAIVKEGDRVCAQGIVFSAKDGKELMNTWKNNQADCSMVIAKGSTNPMYYALLHGKKLNTTIAFGIPGQGKIPPYLMVMTLISAKKSITRATGTEVKNIPATLPIVTRNAQGKPSLDLNGYKPNDTLISQTTIEGTGSLIKANSTIQAHYTGWVADANGKLKQFDSSWDRGMPANFTLGSGLIAGWNKGLPGKKVGSQILLIIPPNDGYGKEDKKDAKGNVTIPANSTLYFVIDVLYAS